MLLSSSRMADRSSDCSSSSTTKVSNAVIRLPKGAGFALDLSPSREDPLARRACESVFGKDFVDGCFKRLHRSTLSYEALVSDLMGFDRPHARSDVRSDPVYQMAFQSIRDDLKIEQKLVPRTIGAVPKLPDFPRAKSPGLPYKLEGYSTKGDVVDVQANVDAINVNWHHIGAGIRHEPLPDTCLFARTQVCSVEKQKIRGVWGYPLSVYMEEARFFYPILAYLKSDKHALPSGYGYEISSGGMIALTDMAIRSPGARYLMTDWSQFDKSIPAWLIRDAFALLAELIDFGHVEDSEGLVWPVRELRSRRRWKKLVDYFIETPVRTCKGERFLVRSGVPSGSCFTNVIDTIVNCLVTRYLCYHTFGSFPRGEVYLGDDGVCVLPAGGNVNLQVMSDLAEKAFGLNLNADKSFVTTNIENIHFLGYHNRPVGLPNRDQSLLVTSFIHPERTRRTAEECAAAALGQLWANFDPTVATLWYRVLIFVSDAFLVSHDSVIVQLRKTAHRHKYLYHIGRNVAAITIPTPSEFGTILEVLPSPVPRRLPPVRAYDYSRLSHAGYLFWSAGDKSPDSD